MLTGCCRNLLQRTLFSAAVVRCRSHALGALNIPIRYGTNQRRTSPLCLEANFDVIVKSRNKTAKKKDPDARRANPEE